MRSGINLLLGCLLASFLWGCRSTGPKFDPHQAHLDSGNREAPSPYASDLISRAAPAFSPVESTNRIRPEWLKPPDDFFKLGPGDIFEIEILGEPSSHSTVVLGPDGKVYYDLLPGTFVWGLTLSEAKQELENGLAKFMRVKPEIALTLRGVGSKRIWILGSIQKPGVYSLATPLTLLEAISAAGGTVAAYGSEEIADLENSFVMREGKLLSVDFYALLKQGDLSQNVYLQPDDFVYLRSVISKDVYVLGAVVLPTVVDYSDQTSLVSAIAIAGGTLEYAYLSQVAIIRGSLTHPTIATVDYKRIVKGHDVNIRLAPGDIVYVPFAPYRKLAIFAESILNQFVRTIAVNEGQRAVIRNASPVGVTLPFGIGVAVPAK
jgi:polysaccharide biosynthesis/export protein